jgi:branched-subunit amino acid aminotransferase/4-amino-4-deoxychorismate lyase
MGMCGTKVWVGGRLVAEEALKVSVVDRTFEHGLGLFETFRTWSGHATLLERHLSRLQRSAAVLDLTLDPKALPDANAVAALRLGNRFPGDALLRITLTGGIESSSALTSTLWMRRSPLPTPTRVGGAVVSLGPYEVLFSHPLARHKTLNYWEKRLVFEKARGLGYDEVLTHCAGRGYQEGSRTNLFVISGGRLITPSVEGPLLPGVMRGLVIEHARNLPLEVSEEAGITQEMLRDANEVFLTNSARGIIPVGCIHGPGWPGTVPWRKPAPGPWTQRLWSEVSHWLHQGGIT